MPHVHSSMPHILRMIVAIRCKTVLVAGSFISSALTHKAWCPTRWALWMTWLTVRTLHLRAQDTQPTSFKPLSMECGLLWLSATDMELRNSYMYGVNVIFHQQLLQVSLQHAPGQCCSARLQLLFYYVIMLKAASRCAHTRQSLLQALSS